MLDQVIAFHK